MDNLHVITGMPRSGSTLLRNVLAQNPAFHVSATSPVLSAVVAMQKTISKSPELRSELVHDNAGTKARLQQAVKGFISGWYSGHAGRVCFDTCRGWSSMASLHSQLYPDGVRIVCVRDLRAIFASIEKQHLKYPLLDPSETLAQKTMAERARQMFADDGIIGMGIVGVEDLLRRRPRNTIFLPYERFTSQPADSMAQVYEMLRMEPFNHTFDNVVNQSTECDAFYLDKFPHEGSGKVEPSRDDWADHCPPDIAKEICSKFPLYNGAFREGPA